MLLIIRMIELGLGCDIVSDQGQGNTGGILVSLELF